MATRSYIIKQNKDGTFNARYHHWDGYPLALGNFLSQNLSSPQRVGWLFGLNRAFSSIMAKKSEYEYSSLNKNPNSDEMVEYDKSFSCLQDKYIKLLNSQDQISTDVNMRASFDVLKEICDEEYQYFYDNKKNKWNIVIEFKDSLEDSVFLEVEKFMNYFNILKYHSENPNKSYIAEKMSISEEKLDSHLRSWLNHQSHPSIKNFIEYSAHSFINNVYDNRSYVKYIDSLAQKVLLEDEIKSKNNKPRERPKF